MEKGNPVMPTFFKIYKERRLVMSVISGVVAIADALAHRQNPRKHPVFDPSFSQLVDLSNVTKIAFSREDVETFAQDTIFSLNSRRAAVVTGDLAYGLARMFEMLREAKGEEGLRVFRNLDEALDWVLAKNASFPPTAPRYHSARDCGRKFAWE
jgi:hypothetical protein